MQVIDVGNGGVVVDQVEESRAYWELHEGAMYMNQGVTYKVFRLDTLAKEAFVNVSTEQYYTGLKDHTDVNVVSRTSTTVGGRTHFGRAQVIMSAWGYQKIWKRTGLAFETCELTLPPIEYMTYALWHDMRVEVKYYLDAHGWDFLAGLHGAGHAVMAVMPLFLMCCREDLGTCRFMRVRGKYVLPFPCSHTYTLYAII